VHDYIFTALDKHIHLSDRQLSYSLLRDCSIFYEECLLKCLNDTNIGIKEAIIDILIIKSENIHAKSSHTFGVYLREFF
jgi:hypothetical protein